GPGQKRVGLGGGMDGQRALVQPHRFLEVAAHLGVVSLLEQLGGAGVRVHPPNSMAPDPQTDPPIPRVTFEAYGSKPGAPADPRDQEGCADGFPPKGLEKATGVGLVCWSWRG